MDVLHIERDHHPAGEYTFTPALLTLSLALGPSLALEQVIEGRPWSGRSTRGAVNVMPAGGPRVFRHDDGCSFACVTIPDRTELRPRVALRDEPLRLILEALVAALDAADASRLFRDAVAQAVLARLAALDGQPPDQRPPGLRTRSLARVLEYLDAHLADDLSVDELARVAELSPAHFSTLFRASFGEPPHQHLVRRRVERARALLEEGADPSAAAFAVGFYDQSHLGRHMRRLLGVTPGMIARARRSSKERPDGPTNVQDARSRAL